MKIESPEQLETLVKLCRKLGVEGIEVDGIKLTLKEPPKRNRKSKESEEVNEDVMTDDQLLFWSSQPLVGNDG